LVDIDGLFATARLFEELSGVVFDRMETEEEKEIDMFL